MTDIEVVHVDDIEAVEVAPGITRRPLPATERARGWLIDFAPAPSGPPSTTTTGKSVTS